MSSPPLRRHPAWFGSVMGTAGLSLAFLQESSLVGGTAFVVVADALLVLASAIALVLLPVYVARPRDRQAFAAELGDPMQGPLLATFPAGLLVLASAWAVVGSGWLGSGVGLTVSAVLVIAGALIGIGLSVVWASTQARGDLDLADVNGAWVIPPVMSIIVPLSIAPQMTAHPDQAAWLLAVGLAFYGVAIFLFLPIFALIVARNALRPPFPPAMSPSMWIPLAPAGLMGLSLLHLMQAGVDTDVLPDAAVTLAIVVASMGLGLGLWWALFAVGDLVRSRRGGGVPFHPGWWGFVFPIAAMELSLGALGAELASGPVEAAGVVGLGVFFAVWLLVAIRSTSATIGRARASDEPA